ncbi:MAG: PAS domain S-box protein [bacterium]
MRPQAVRWSLTKKFSLIIIMVFMPASLVVSFLTYRREYLARVEGAREKARLVARSLHENWYEMGSMSSMGSMDAAGEEEGRMETHSENASQEPAGNFHSHIGHRPGRMERILEKTLSLSVRYVACNPRNPENMADSFEREGIAVFERNKDQGEEGEYVKLVSFQGKKALRCLKPLRAREFCLQCHGQGHDDKVNNDKVNDGPVLGAISIIIPVRPQALFLEHARERFLWLNLGLTVLMVLIWLVFAKTSIIDRLENLSEGMAVFSREENSGDDTPYNDIPHGETPHDEVGHDEIGSVFSAFQVMRASVSRKIRSLKREVDIYRILTRSAAYGMMAIDEEGRILFFNTGAERIFGWKRGEILNQKAGLLIPHRLRRDYKHAFIRSMVDESPAGAVSAGEHGVSTEAPGVSTEEPIETFGLRRSGEEFPVHLSTSTGKAAGGRIFTAIIRDITQQKRKEGEITRQNEKLVLLARVSTGLLLERDLKKLAEYSLEESLELTDSPFGLFLLKDKDGNLVPLASLGLSVQTADEKGCQVFRPVGVLGDIMRQRKPQIINTSSRGMPWSGSGANRTVLSFGRFSFHSFLGVPIISDQEVIGIICLADRPAGYTNREQELVAALAKDLSLLIVRNAIEKETRILKEEFQTLFDQASDMIVICTLEGKIQAVNHRVVQYTGYPYQELIDHAFWKLHLPDEERRIREFLHRVAAGETCRIESFFRQKEGGSFPVDLHANIVACGDHQVIQVVIRDMVQFKQAESDLKGRIEWLTKKLDDLRRETSFFRMAVDALPEYIILTDRTGRIILANAAFCRRLGYPMDELMGQPVEFLFGPGLSVDIVDQIIGQALKGGWEGKVVHLAQGGQEISLELSLQAVRGSGDGALGLLGIYAERRLQ